MPEERQPPTSPDPHPKPATPAKAPPPPPPPPPAEPPPPAAPASPRSPGPVPRALRAAAALAGVGLIAYGLYGLLHDSYIADPADVLWWAVGGLLLHDGLWLPLVCLVGALLARSTAVRAALTIAAAVTAVALPSVLRADVNHGNPSVLPLPYLRNWLVALAVIAVATAGWTLLRRHRRRRRHRPVAE